MIPHKIHYCWFGGGPLPQLAEECMASWHRMMPDWEYVRWDEGSFDVQSVPYTAEAYAAGKMAFVSDYVRLYALQQQGGVYMDVDFEVYRPFDALLGYEAFAGFEGSKHLPVMMGVCGSVAGGRWVEEMLRVYEGLHFLRADGTPDLTTNVQRLTAAMAARGLRQDGTEQDCCGLHVLPVDYFSPRQTTGEYFRTENTYCEHRGLDSWSGHSRHWKARLRRVIGQRAMTRLIKAKRALTKR